MVPEIILYYWQGPGPIPDWRLACHNKLVALYPSARIVKSEGYREKYLSYYSDHWRLQQCSKSKRVLWVDNDIELISPLELTEKPGLADEFQIGHLSIMWSGDNPEVFKDLITPTSYKNQEMQDRVKSGLIDKIKIPGTHWATEENGNKVRRFK